MVSPPKWTQADKKLLLELDKANPGMTKKQLMGMFNVQAEESRTYSAFSLKLSRLKTGGPPDNRRRKIKPKKELKGVRSRPNSRSGLSSFSSALEGRTVSDSESDRQTDQLASDYTRSPTPPPHPPRRAISATPSGPLVPRHGPAHRQPSAKPAPAPRQAAQAPERKPDVRTEEEGVSELSAIQTKRKLARVLEEICVAEDAYLDKYGVMV